MVMGKVHLVHCMASTVDYNQGCMEDMEDKDQVEDKDQAEDKGQVEDKVEIGSYQSIDCSTEPDTYFLANKEDMIECITAYIVVCTAV